MKKILNTVFILLALFYSSNSYSNDFLDSSDLDTPDMDIKKVDSKTLDTYIDKSVDENPSTKDLHKSFTYYRLGGFAFLIYPFGGEVAVGHRFRSKYFGFGPLLNVSLSPATTPAIMFKIEALCYPSGKGFYFGLMPGVGIAKSDIFGGGHHHNSWTFCPGLEAVFGKEFLSSTNNRSFFYVSISPFFVTSFNYGWSF
ncbi:MAG: hypothetical protein K1060chlam4_00740 [Candidatus Anoxychlamydiales bacterium]|nr:hypothetical protein [Candidatus Anoxychlamydiales bacterium]